MTKTERERQKEAEVERSRGKEWGRKEHWVIAFFPVCPGAMCDWPAYPVAAASLWIWREAFSTTRSLGLFWEAFMGFISSSWMAQSLLPHWKESIEETYTTRIRSKIIIQSQHKQADWVSLATTEGEKRISFCSLGFWAHPSGLLWVRICERTWRTVLHWDKKQAATRIPSEGARSSPDLWTVFH